MNAPGQLLLFTCPFWPEINAEAKSESPKPKTQIETAARNSQRRNDSLATQSTRKHRECCSSIFKFYGTNSSVQRHGAKIADAEWGLLSVGCRGAWHLSTNSLWEIKCYVIESLLTQMAHDQLHFGQLQFQLSFSSSYSFIFNFNFCCSSLASSAAWAWHVEGRVPGDLVFRWGKARLIIRLKAISLSENQLRWRDESYLSAA